MADTAEARATVGAQEESDASSRLGTEKVGTLLLKFSIPSITGMLVNALYNVVDRIFVGRGVDENALGGISLVLPLMTIAFAFAMLIGIGSANLISMRLGQKRKKEAENALNHSFVMLFVVGVILTALGLAFLDPLLSLLGAKEGSPILVYARDYFQVTLYGTVFTLIGFGLSHCARAQGFPKVSMTGMLIGAILNTILDPIFIFVFKWGVKGAAWATVISQIVSCIYFLSFVTSKKAVVRLTFGKTPFHIRAALDILLFGSSQFLLQLAMSLAQFVLNRAIVHYGAVELGFENGGEAALSAMAVAGSIGMLILMPIFGINQGAQPILGYNYGAKKWSRVFSAYTKAVIAATCICTAGFIVTQLFAVQLVSLFAPDGSAIFKTFAPWTLRTFFLFLPLAGCQIVTTNMFVVTGRPKISILLSLLRQVLLLIPFILILSPIFGLRGVVYAAPAADAISVVITIILGVAELKKLLKKSPATGDGRAT